MEPILQFFEAAPRRISDHTHLTAEQLDPSDLIPVVTPGVRLSRVTVADLIDARANTAAKTLAAPFLNDSGANLPAGTPVYVSGISAGGLLTIEPAQANSAATALVVGVTANALADEASGTLVRSATLSGINTSALDAGAPVWLSDATPGELTKTKPGTAVLIGYCLVAHATSGSILLTL